MCLYWRNFGLNVVDVCYRSFDCQGNYPTKSSERCECKAKFYKKRDFFFYNDPLYGKLEILWRNSHFFENIIQSLCRFKFLLFSMKIYIFILSWILKWMLHDTFCLCSVYKWIIKFSNFIKYLLTFNTQMQWE